MLSHIQDIITLHNAGTNHYSFAILLDYLNVLPFVGMHLDVPLLQYPPTKDAVIVLLHKMF